MSHATTWHDDVVEVTHGSLVYIETAQLVARVWRQRSWTIRRDAWTGAVTVRGSKRRPAHIDERIDEAVEYVSVAAQH
ncbi:hypothetical protein [Pseudoclavibacter sp. RFBA6]|uniref:hypothetical protein n=1 Tax=Pseudoclavibacter sp. RFBA6 TaxID=2080573 RepID=UPI000CE72659|nr:hypothetical protein [Pseudoclavibacter sp. RFBA6]PPG39496.1 hypothetical protein C5C17_11945 [Pseudoclavibacter sp. RFBA6]